MKALIITFDHLHLGLLGCYGNELIETPNLDRLASESVVFDWHFGENLSPSAVNHAWWTGRSTFPASTEQQAAQDSLIRRLREAGVRTRLWIEADSHLPAAAADFGEVITLPSFMNDDEADEEDDIPFAHLVDLFCEALEEPETQTAAPELFWLHGRGIDIDSESPPDAELLAESDAEADQDDPLQQRHTAAVRVIELDYWIGELLDAADEAFAGQKFLVIVTAAAGASLGEHPPSDELPATLYEEQTHTPLLVRLPDPSHAGEREAALVQTTDLAPTLFDFFAVAAMLPAGQGVSLREWIENRSLPRRDAIILGRDRHACGIRTGTHYYVRSGPPDSRSEQTVARLFSKPEDRWDQADLLRQEPELAAELEQRLVQFLELHESGGSSQPGDPA